VIGGGCSDDGFLDFKGWLVSRGEKVFEAALAKPDSLAKVVSPGECCEAQGFHFGAQLAWARKTGKAVTEFPDSPLGPGKGGISGEPWDEDALPKLLPKLSKKFAC
jgi:hypothetical protein